MCISYVYIYTLYMDVSENSGTPKWMVYDDGKPMDDLGVPLFLETPISICFIRPY